MYISSLRHKKLPWIYGLRFDPISFSVLVDISFEAVEIINKYFFKLKDGFDEIAKLQQYKDFNFVLDKKQNVFGYEGIGEVSFDHQKDLFSINFLLKPADKSGDQVRKRHSQKLTESLAILFGGCRSYLLMCGENLSAPLNTKSFQLFEVDTSTGGGGFHGYAIAGFVSKELRFFLHEQGELSYKESIKIRDSFRLNIEKLFGYKGDAKLNFDSDGGFLVQVPGNACDISVYGDQREKPLEKAVEFDSHNVDAAQQQLGLLMGLATILDMYYQKNPEYIYWK